MKFDQPIPIGHPQDKAPLRVLLISSYELGRQPFGLASPAAWLRAAGAHVICLDLAVSPLEQSAIAAADLIACYVPMHTATRLTADLIPTLRRLNPQAHLCCYGLYAPMNEAYLRQLGIHTILGGEFEAELTSLYQRLATGAHNGAQVEATISLARLPFLTPDRADLPPLSAYAHLTAASGATQLVGYTEASRGCKHQCKHCPVVPIYNGRFRLVPHAVVLADIRQQVMAGAQHITFGDPDFFNGPGHALPLVQALHAEFPHVTYDVTIKVTHLLQQRNALPQLRDTGCILVTTAVESLDDRVLGILGKGHTVADFYRAVQLCRSTDLALNPTFIAFTPWTTLSGYRHFLHAISDLELIENVAPIQYAIRLLLPAGSHLLHTPAMRPYQQSFDPAALVHPWTHPDPAVDALQQQIMDIVKTGVAARLSRRRIFSQVWLAAHTAAGVAIQTRAAEQHHLAATTPIPFLSEPWYC